MTASAHLSCAVLQPHGSHRLVTVQQGGVDTAQYTYGGDGNRVKTVACVSGQ